MASSEGHRERLKEKVKSSFDLGQPFYGLHDYEIVEYYLFFLLPRIDTKPIAKDLIRKFGSLPNILDASISELTQIDGIKEKTAYAIKSLRELVNQYSNSKILHTKFNFNDTVKNLITLYKNKQNEHIFVIFLNSNERITRSEFLNEGKIASVKMDIPKISTMAVKDDAKYVIIAHNHPNAEALPSNEDVILTKNLEKALSSLEIKLLDHIIISNEEFFSFSKEGLL